MWCELETWMLRLYRRQMWELMGDQPLDASNVQNMVDHMNSQAIFWKHIIIWCCTSQINCLTKENNSEQCSFHFATSSHHNLQDCVSFFLDTSLLVNTIEKKIEFVAGDSMACDGICDRATVPGHCLPGWTPGTHVGSHSLVWSEAQKTSTDLFN